MLNAAGSQVLASLPLATSCSRLESSSTFSGVMTERSLVLDRSVFRRAESGGTSARPSSIGTAIVRLANATSLGDSCMVLTRSAGKPPGLRGEQHRPQSILWLHLTNRKMPGFVRSGGLKKTTTAWGRGPEQATAGGLRPSE
eukprot:CAMPEP_0204279886 /NCGR_PEP_ID=MMETSP0468-20130131/36609_1 /ASSEMBLY_ACC=CAM_ASM_000383 /TAXON_ID=2969 /ORGANISM="Oxyrrhis marina" /LENGTH=141 /DNA_ID=CAMNT_0051257039 /DNA_START=392 /DNA_END=816 /DNA_ORIENTATION=-